MTTFQGRWGRKARVRRMPVKNLSWAGIRLSFGVTGQCDLTAVLYGCSVEVEVKTGTGRREQPQIDWAQSMEEAEAIYVLAHARTPQEFADEAERVCRAIERGVERLRGSWPPGGQRQG